jgi:hypothetical protein
VIVEAAPLGATQFAAQYELLRSHVIAAAGDAAQKELGVHPRGVGLGLLLREGMPGWLNAVDAAIRASAVQRTADISLRPPAGGPAEFSVASPWLSGVRRKDIAALLTSLVLSTRRVERSSPREGYRLCQ